MMKTIFDKFDKDAISSLERVCFQGRIEVIQSTFEADRAVDFLLSQPIIGFDTETKPNFQRGQSSMVALLQVSAQNVCFLFRLNVLGLPDSIKRLLSDEGETIKVGLSWHDDICGLLKRGFFRPGTFIDIQHIAKEMGIQDQSLQKLYANLLGQRVSKSQQLSNWEAPSLTDAQKNYAATDAWACIQLYEEMMRLRQEGYLIRVNPVTEPVKPMVFPVSCENALVKAKFQEENGTSKTATKKASTVRRVPKKRKPSDSAKDEVKVRTSRKRKSDNQNG